MRILVLAIFIFYSSFAMAESKLSADYDIYSVIHSSNSKACAYFEEREQASLSLLHSPLLIAQYEHGSLKGNSVNVGVQYDIINLPRSRLTTKLYAAKCDISLIEDKVRSILLVLSQSTGSVGFYKKSLSDKAELLESAYDYFSGKGAGLRRGLKSGNGTIFAVQSFEKRLLFLKETLIQTKYGVSKQKSISLEQLETLPTLLSGLWAAVTRRDYAEGQLRALSAGRLNIRAGTQKGGSHHSSDIANGAGLSTGSANDDSDDWEQYVGVQLSVNLGMLGAMRHERQASLLAADAQKERISSLHNLILRTGFELTQKIRTSKERISALVGDLSKLEMDYSRLSKVKAAKYDAYKLQSRLNIGLRKIDREVYKVHVRQLRKIVAILKQATKVAP